MAVAEAPITEAPVIVTEEEAPEEKVSVFVDFSAKEFAIYDIEIEIIDSILGGIPSDPHMIRGWLQRNAGVEQHDLNKKMLIDTMADLGYDVSELNPEDELDALEAAAAELAGLTKTVRFKVDKKGLFIEPRQVKAGLRESANIAFPPESGWFSKLTGKPSTKKDPNSAKGLKNLMAEWVFVKPNRIYLGRTEPDEIITKVSHTKNGASMGLVESATRPTIAFEIHSFRDLVQWEQWGSIFAVFEKEGLGASRSMGYGQFVTTKFERRSRSKRQRP